MHSGQVWPLQVLFSHQVDVAVVLTVAVGGVRITDVGLAREENMPRIREQEGMRFPKRVTAGIQNSKF